MLFISSRRRMDPLHNIGTRRSIRRRTQREVLRVRSHKEHQLEFGPTNWVFEGLFAMTKSINLHKDTNYMKALLRYFSLIFTEK